MYVKVQESFLRKVKEKNMKNLNCGASVRWNTIGKFCYDFVNTVIFVPIGQ